MSLKLVIFNIFVLVTICISSVKSDISQLPPEKKAADVLALFLQDNRFRDQIIHALTTTDIQATQELLLISQYREAIRDRIQHIQGILNLRRPNQIEPRVLMDELRRHLVVIVERTRGEATVEQLIEYRRTLVRHLHDLYDLQERATRRSELDTLINHINIRRQYEQQQRLEEPILQDQVAKDKRAKEHLTLDLLERDIRLRVQNLQHRIDRDQSIDNEFQTLVNVVVNLWISYQSHLAQLKVRREMEKQDRESHVTVSTTPLSPKNIRRIDTSSFRQTGNGLRKP